LAQELQTFDFPIDVGIERQKFVDPLGGNGYSGWIIQRD
jgi:hypothetical protein